MFASPLVLVFFCRVLRNPDSVFNPTIISLETPYYQLVAVPFSLFLYVFLE